MPDKPNVQHHDNIPLAVTVIVYTVLGLSLGDALIKFTSGEFVIWQIFVLRSLLVLPVLLALIWWKFPDAFRAPLALKWTILRSLMLVAMWIAYYLALPHLELSIAAASYYTLPIFITLFSAILIGDRIKPIGWIAVFLGFFGVLLILRPKAGDFNLYTLLPLLSAILYALAMILTRTKCRAVSPYVLSVSLNVAFVLVGIIAATLITTTHIAPRTGFLLAPWADMETSEWIAMGLLAAAMLIGSTGTAIAYQKAPPSIIGTFDFAYVGFAILWGLIFFSETPDLFSLIGIACIVTAGIMSLRN